MKFLITGGSGFLGKHVSQKLLADGHDVVILGRNPEDDSDGTISYVSADITDRKSLEQVRAAHSDISTIIHMAALVPKTKEEDLSLAMVEANIVGTVNVLEIFGKNLTNFVYASTAEVYGLPAAGGTISEGSIAIPLSYYGASKLAGELFCTVYAKQHDLCVSMLRFTVLYGPGDRINRAIPNFIRKALAGQALEIYGGEELRDYLHVSDAAEAIYLAATKPSPGVFNVGTGQGISIKKTAQTIVELANPAAATKVLPRQKPAADIVLNIDKARQELGFEPKHFFPDLLEEQILWQKQQT